MSSSQTVRWDQSRRGWCDLLECLACAAVVVLHAAGGTSAPLAAITRWSAPVLVMLAGAFLLDPDYPVEGKRWRDILARLALITFLAAALFALWDARGAHWGVEWFLEGLILFVRGEFHYHLWLLFALLGPCLLTPLLRSLVRGVSRRTLWWAVGLWAVASLGLTLLCPADPGRLWMVLRVALGCAGCYLLGHLLQSCQMRLPACLGLWLAGGACLGAALWAAVARDGFAARFFSGFSPFTVCTAAAVFLALRRLDRGKHPVWAGLSRLALWVYLLHPLVLELLF